MPTSFRNTKKVSWPTQRVHWIRKKKEEEEENRVREAEQPAISEANRILNEADEEDSA